MTHSSGMPAGRSNRLLALGPHEGWHADQLRAAASVAGYQLQFACYESLSAGIDVTGVHTVSCDAGTLQDFDAVLMRTMPAGSLEQITFRLAVLHRLQAEGMPIINSPRSLETAIDKYATLAAVQSLGYEVPATVVVQSRREAVEAFRRLGGDCVVKPIFGGEGRGVMRIMDEELAWTTFSALERIDSVVYIQQFIPPGGSDIRLFVIGENVWGVRRQATDDWRTNVSRGANSHAVLVSDAQRKMALRIARCIGIEIGSVDLIDADDGRPRVLEVNGVPGWKGAQAALGVDLAEQMINLVAAKARGGGEGAATLLPGR